MITLSAHTAVTRAPIQIPAQSRQWIAARAAELITPGITVILGGGRTTRALVAQLRPDLDVTIITHSATTAAALAGHPRADVIILGGRLHKSSVSASGAATAEAAWGVTADLALLVFPGIHPERGLTIDDPDLAAMKRILISRAADTYVMASAQQLGAVCACKVTDICDIAGIITDAPASHPTMGQLRDQGTTIISARRSSAPRPVCSRRARWAPRQKCGPAEQKPTYGWGSGDVEPVT